MFDRETAHSEEIDVAEEAHVAWIRSQRDASLWHQATIAALAHRSDPHDFIPWVLTQPELDRASGARTSDLLTTSSAWIPTSSLSASGPSTWLRAVRFRRGS